MSDQQRQKLQQQMQLSQQLQQTLGGQNPLLGSLQARYGSALSNRNPYPNMGMPLPTPAPFDFNVQPQPAAPASKPWPGFGSPTGFLANNGRPAGMG